MTGPTARHVHVVGAGLAGLAAAVVLAEDAATRVTVWDASPKAGGRCRSYHDTRLDRVLDNGNHLILSGNAAVLEHAARIGARDRLEVLPDAAFPFVDLDGGARWTVRIPRTPLGGLRRDARPRGARIGELAGALTLLLAGRGRTVAEAVRGRGPMWRAFWEPMTLAVLNTPPETASAALLATAMRQSFFRGAAACRPVIAPGGLGAALVDPAVAMLKARGAALRFRAPLAGIEVATGRVRALRIGGDRVDIGPRDAVILAVPPAALAQVMPEVEAPDPGLAILNAHFRTDPAFAAALPPILGVLGGAVHWIFTRGDVVSVTVSAAESFALWGAPKEAVLARLWADIAAAGGGAPPPLAARLLIERRATFAQTPAEAARRPAMRTLHANLMLAGDHTATGLPATILGAVTSGVAAARALG